MMIQAKLYNNEELEFLNFIHRFTNSNGDNELRNEIKNRCCFAGKIFCRIVRKRKESYLLLIICLLLIVCARMIQINQQFYHIQLMNQNTDFNFTQDPDIVPVDSDFKQKKQIYLAERINRKKQAQLQFRKNFQRSSSSESDQGLEKIQPVAIKSNNKDTHTDSSKSSNQNGSKSKREREQYKAMVLARRQQMMKLKKQEFGSSSSEQESVPINPRLRIVSEPKTETTPKTKFLKEDEIDNASCSSLDLEKKPQKPKINLMASVRLKTCGSDKKEVREIYQVETPSKKGISIWVEKQLEFKVNSIELNERSFAIYDLNKVKLLFTRTPSGRMKIKAIFKDEELYFAINHKKFNQSCLDHYYFFFAKMVMIKLQLMGKKHNSQAKGKLAISQQFLKGAQIMGKVRKSSFFGGWEEKIAIINSAGLSIFKQGKEKASLVIGYGSIRQLWTRFEFDNDNLIIKFWHNTTKIELSIPVENYLNRENWLFHIYSLSIK